MAMILTFGGALMSTFIGRAIAISLAVLVAWKANNWYVGRKAVTRHVEKSDTLAKKVGRDARKAHSRARSSDAIKRLLSEYGQ